MADTQAPGDTTRPSGSMTVDTGEAPVRGGTVTTARKGETAFQEERSAASVTVGGDERDGLRPQQGLDDARPEDDAGGVGSSPDETPGEGGDESPDGGADTAPEDLGDYLPDDPEVAAKFDERYFTDAGKLNTSSLEAEWFANAKDGKDHRLNEGTYKFLEQRLGISRELADGYGQGLMALQEKRDAEFYAGAGGKDRFDAAFAWATGQGGYTQAQKDRFNEAIKKGGAEAEDARDALMSRYSRANNKAQRDARRGPPGVPSVERRAPKDVTARAGRGGDGLQPFGSREEASKFFREAKGDDAKMAIWRKRLGVSPDHIRN